ncbi:serine/threonine protein kinase [Polytolypa hystricis UAMH7299]|uniref:Serine/threonine protein kinase n=1 Tax=Polytolypa hystricis (strain UAMH7299) TaxID=1447883 RepID=A0A2B7YGU9_POLH7|nr:serine/threonine protein kinase [Polytolypa hystricis UAMH7299]
MAEFNSLWWPDERVNRTLSREYIASCLPSELHSKLERTPSFGDDLTDDTYLDWILDKARKLFLILNDIGIPERIFFLVDETYDDADLPIASHSVDLFRLSPAGEDVSLESRFFKAQWRFLVRGIKAGEHVKYGSNEGVPVDLVAHRIGLPLTSKDQIDKVVVTGATCRHCLRISLPVGHTSHILEEDEILREVESLKRLAHEHLISIYSSYFVDDSVNVLLSESPEYSLKSFLNDKPQAFKRLSKADRNSLMLNWPHCLSNAVAWLHAHGHAHGAIRPSNIMMDSNNRIFLGLFDAFNTLIPLTKPNDMEAYQYAAPEDWVRTVSVQHAGTTRAALPSGSRTMRKRSTSRPGTSHSIISTSFPSSQADGFFQNGLQSPAQDRFSSNPESPTVISRTVTSPSAKDQLRRNNVKSGFYAASTVSWTSSSSSDATTRPVTAIHRVASQGNLNSKDVIVQTWESRQYNAFPSDIFALAAITLDIFTCLCKRKHSDFVHHRGAKNRNAGRGGSVADASFHLDRNSNQVNSWIGKLERDATKQSDPVFCGVKPMLAIVKQMLYRDPESRPLASQVALSFSSAISQLKGAVELHCCSQDRCNTIGQKLNSDPAPSLSKTSTIAASDDSPLHSKDTTSSTSSHFTFNFKPLHWKDDQTKNEPILEEEPYEPGILVIDSGDEADDRRWQNDSSLYPSAVSPTTKESPSGFTHYTSSNVSSSDVLPVSSGAVLTSSQRQVKGGSNNNNFSRLWGGGAGLASSTAEIA